jgi:hypothetical protein
MNRANNKNILIVDNTLSGKIVDDTDRVDGAAIYWDEAEDKYKHAPIDPATGVPYTGAIYDVDLGTHSLTAESVIFNDTPTITPSERELGWDVDNDTLSFGIPDGGIIQINQEPFDYYLNLEGSQIVNGDIVSVTGAASTKTAVVLCDATDATLARNVIGMVTVATINDNQVGRITKNGGKVRMLNTNAYNEGDILYVDPLNPGKWTNVMPTAPNRAVKIGTVTVKSLTEGVVELHLHCEAKLTELADVDGTPLTTLGQIPVWHQTEGVFDFDYNITDYYKKAGLELSKQLSGFVYGDAITATYNHTNRTITLTGDLTYLWKGEVKTLTSPWTSTAHTATAGMWFLYSTDGTTFSWSMTPFEFWHIQVAIAKYAATAVNSWAQCEMHGLMDYEAHEELHSQIGTYRVSGGQVTAGTITENTATDAAVTPGFDVAVVKDEDVSTTIPAWTQGTYTTMYIAAGSIATFSTVQTRPFHAGVGEYMYLNNPTTGAFAQGINARYYNVYQIMIPTTADADSQKYRMVMLQPQAEYTSLASAQAEDPRILNFGNLSNLSPEFVLYTRITFLTGAGNANNGKCTIPTNGVTYVVGSRAGQVSISGVSINNHQSLSNLTWGSSGHLGTASSFAAFDSSGAATNILTNTIAQISQVITNGVTDKSPSEDAVYDALALKLANVVEDTTPELGGDLSMNQKNINNTATLSVNQSYSGLIESATVGENVAFGDVLYLKFSDGKWWKAQANAVGTTPAKRMALATITADASGVLLIQGSVRYDSWTLASNKVFLSAATAGAVVTTAPSSSGNQVQCLGTAKTSTTMYFDPSNDVGEV